MCEGWRSTYVFESSYSDKYLEPVEGTARRILMDWFIWVEITEEQAKALLGYTPANKYAITFTDFDGNGVIAAVYSHDFSYYIVLGRHQNKGKCRGCNKRDVDWKHGEKYCPDCMARTHPC